ncbi:MAG: DUF6163 family protein [Hyphomicrobiales bacterium]|jgi:hypothetical protein|nr:DUF6163 family protein [Hyphomicrobiales bacterium]
MANRSRDPGLINAARPAAAVGVNWSRINIWFHRLLALGWMAQGLTYWATILDAGSTASRAFEARTLSFQAVTIYFAVVDILSAVGLWLLAPWGSVVWLIAAVSRLVLASVFPLTVPLGLIAAAAVIGCVVIYGALALMLARSQR